MPEEIRALDLLKADLSKIPIRGSPTFFDLPRVCDLAAYHAMQRTLQLDTFKQYAKIIGDDRVRGQLLIQLCTGSLEEQFDAFTTPVGMGWIIDRCWRRGNSDLKDDAEISTKLTFTELKEIFKELGAKSGLYDPRPTVEVLVPIVLELTDEDRRRLVQELEASLGTDSGQSSPESSPVSTSSI